MIDIVIPTFNRENLLKDCLASLQTQTDSRFRVIVVDSGTIRPDLSASLPFSLLYLKNHKDNLAAAYNLGISHCTSDLIGFLDDDVVTGSDWVAAMHQLSATCPEFAGWGGPVIEVGFRRTRFLRKNIGTEGSLFFRLYDLFLLHGEGGAISRMSEYGAYSFGQMAGKSGRTPVEVPTPVDILSNANMVLRSSVLKRMGGFDEGFDFSYQDGDLFLRLKGTGYRLCLGPWPVVEHRIAGGGATRALEAHTRDFEYFLRRIVNRNPTFRIWAGTWIYRVAYATAVWFTTSGSHIEAFRRLLRGWARGRREFEARGSIPVEG
jgi:GT2 family glycosyltransferase